MDKVFGAIRPLGSFTDLTSLCIHKLRYINDSQLDSSNKNVQQIAICTTELFYSNLKGGVSKANR